MSQNKLRDWYYKLRYQLNFLPWKVDPSLTQVRSSPSGRLILTIRRYKTRSGYWDVSRGTVRERKTGRVIADVRRNYNHFPFCWVENHPDGSYLICGEDYQGYTIVNLVTGAVRSHIPQAAKRGAGYCWIDVKPSPDLKTLAVGGCVWAGSQEVRFYDFTYPDSLPFEELGSFDCADDGEWVDDKTFEGMMYREFRKSDGKPLEELTDEELDLLDNGLIEEKEVIETWERKIQ